MLKLISGRMLRPFARGWVTDPGMKRHGINNLMKWAKRYNNWVNADLRREYDEAYQNHYEELLKENGDDGKPSSIVMRDGWALDTSMTLPHLDDLLREANEIVDARGGRRHSDIQQPFLRSLLFPGDLEKYPALTNFITSSRVLRPVMDYLKTVPVLAKTRPPGIRFMESNAALDPESKGPPRASQLYHIDIHDSPLVYVLVAVQDITLSSGPWTFLPEGVSDRASQTLRYREAGVNYRVTDEKMAAAADLSEAITFACPKGSVLFIDSSRCFHFGSRSSNPPRYQLMYGLTSVCRCDFSQTFMPPFAFPTGPNPSRLRRMVCE